MSDALETLLDDLASRIADKVKDLIEGEEAAPEEDTPPKKKGKGPPKNTIPPEVEDTPPEKEEDEEDEDDEEEEEGVTDEQVEFVTENVELPEEDDMRSELQDMYENLGEDPAEIQNTLLDLEGEELQGAYIDYVARLCEHDHEGNITGIVDDMESTYRSVRVIEEEETLVWAKGTVVLSEEEIEEAGLGDPSEPPKKMVKKAPAKKAPAAKKPTAPEPKKRAVTRKPRGK